MRGSYYQHNATTDAVEEAVENRRIQAEQRLARIQNGMEPSHQNGQHLITLEECTTNGPKHFIYTSTSGRKSPKFRSRQAAEEWRQTHPKWD